MTARLTLIVAIVIAVCFTDSWAQCSLDDDMINTVAIPDGDLDVLFGSTHSIVHPGDQVGFQLIVTNVSQDPVDLWWPVHDPEVLYIQPAAVSNPIDLEFPPIYHEPEILYFYSGGLTLAPGECLTHEFSWDTIAAPCEAGAYRAWSGLVAWLYDVNPPTWEWITPAGGATLNLEMTGEVAVESVSISRIKGLFQ